MITSRICFKNIGDTYYINAALQILIHNNDLIEELLNIMIDDNKEMTKTLHYLYKEIYILEKIIFLIP